MAAGKQGNFQYDAVVIGSGIGGLTSGAFMAKKGLKVLVCEQHSRPGGYFSSFKHKGYTFDGGTQSIEEFGMLFPMLKSLKLTDRLQFSKSRSAIICDKFFVPVEKVDDLNRLYEELARVFPEDARGLNEVRRRTVRLCKLMEAIMMTPSPAFQGPLGLLTQNLPAFLKRIPYMNEMKYFLELYDVPFNEYLKSKIKSQAAVNLIAQMAYFGMPTPFGLTMMMIVMDYYYPLGGFQRFSDELAAYIEAHGGEVRCKAMVEEILVQQGQAVGVRLKQGEEIRSRYVVSNGDMRQAYLKLLPSQHLPDDLRQSLDQSKVSESMFTVYLGLDIPPERLQNYGYHHLLLSPDMQGISFDEVNTDPDFYQRAPIMISIPTQHDPSLAPQGKSIVVLQYFTTAEFADNWSTKDGERTDGYYKLKDKIAAQVIANTEKFIPGISDKVEVQLTATPYTYRRYTLNTGGTTGG